jgi:uncharacterized membrane protein
MKQNYFSLLCISSLEFEFILICLFSLSFIKQELLIILIDEYHFIKEYLK